MSAKTGKAPPLTQKKSNGSLARRRSEQREAMYWAEAQRLSHTGSFGWKPASGQLIWSEESFRIFQYPPTTTPTVELALRRVHPEDRSAVRQRLDRFSRDHKDYQHEYRLLMPDGSIKYVRVVARALNDQSGEVEFVGAIMDITAAKQTEQMLREREAFLAEAQRLTHTGSGVWRVDTDEAVYLSEEWYRIYGFDPSHGLSAWKSRVLRMHPEDQARVKAAKERAVREKTDYQVEHRIVLPDGTVRYTDTVGHPVLDASGEVVRFVCTMMDITERKQAELGREALREAQANLARISRVVTMGELTASLAHELNQPIAAASIDASTCMQWLAGQPPDLEEARAAAARTVIDVTRAGELIRRVRQYFKKEISQPETVDVNEMIREMIAFLRGEIVRNKIAITTDLAKELPCVVGDRVQLQQVLMNLMINGIEAMKETDSTRKLEITSRPAEHNEVVVSVNDTGTGLPQERQEKIFDAFFTTKPQGTGMGLRISRSIVEAHGGRLWASNNLPHGASFHFTLRSGA
ncbi:MAG TPA: PAS domain-containing protein [Candidatus Binatia bacterium]|nr:PAS domain-containing protein [Candidatus Binatia bacterium]